MLAMRDSEHIIVQLENVIASIPFAASEIRKGDGYEVFKIDDAPVISFLKEASVNTHGSLFSSIVTQSRWSS